MIRIDYAKTRAYAKRLAMVAESCAQMNQMVQMAERDIPSYWKGGAAEAFYHSLQSWQQENRAIERELEMLASSIARIADEFETTEHRLADVAGQTGEFPGGSFGGGGGGGRF